MLTHPVEVLQGAVDEDVVPAVKVQCWNGNLVIARANAPPLPVGIVVWVSQPVKEVGCHARVFGMQWWKVFEGQKPVPLGELVLDGLVHLGVQRTAIGIAPNRAVGDGAHGPVFGEGLVEGSAFVGPSVMVIGRRHGRDDGH